MARKKHTPPPAPRFGGQTFLLDSHLDNTELLEQVLQEDGGELVTTPDASLDVFITADTRGRKKSSTRNRVETFIKKGAKIEVINEHAFFISLLPERDEAIAMLRTEKGHARWRNLWNYWNTAKTTLDFNDLDFRKQDLSSCNFCAVQLYGSKLQGANLNFSCLRDLKNNRCDNAKMVRSSFSQASGCSFKKADLSHAHINPAEFHNCDFTGAVLKEIGGSYSTMTDCNFRKADLTQADLENSKLQKLNFAGAVFCNARLAGCDFTGASFKNAVLTGADLTDAKLNNADLTGADLTGAVLVKANLSGATVKGATFKNTTLTGVKLKGVDIASASDLNPENAAKGGKAGASIKQLQEVLEQSKRLQTQVFIEFEGKPVVVGVDCTPTHCSTATYKPNSGYHGYSASLRTGMLDMTKKLIRGELRIETVTAKCVQGPLKARGLKELAIRAWCEAMGVPPLDSAEIAAHLKQYKLACAATRDKWFDVLRTGAAGIRKFNRWVSPHQQCGHGFDHIKRIEHLLRARPFRRADLAGVDLEGVNFSSLDFESSNFERASLKNAYLGDYATFRKASFAGADMQESNCGIGRFSAADFSGANMQNAKLRVCNFRNSNFQSANLQGCDFGYADVSGADFTDANLKRVNWEETKCNSQTKWPRGFKLPHGLLLKA